ncbi:hypothetical protein C8Q70DRAFT_877111, partial [Cubamyces menziesii]
LESLKNKCRKWGIQQAQSQAHSSVTIGDTVEAAHRHFLNAGMREMKAILLHEHGIEHRGVMILKQFWAAGINDIWTVDQHVKLRQWSLYMHIGLEPVSDFILWLKIRWTNCNPRLVASYYCDVVPEHGVCPLIAQSNQGTENNDIANGHTLLCHHYDASLLAPCNTNGCIEREAISSQKFSGARHVTNRTLNQTYRYETPFIAASYTNIYIGWLSTMLLFHTCKLSWTPFSNNKKVLPHRQPALIFANAQKYGWEDFKAIVESEQVSTIHVWYCGNLNHAVFQLVPPVFKVFADDMDQVMGHPEITFNTAWTVYMELLMVIQMLPD